MSRLNELLHQAGSIGRNEDGSITRVGFSREYFQALEFLKGKMEELGMRTETDPVGISTASCRERIPRLASLPLAPIWIQSSREDYTTGCWVWPGQ